MGISLFLVIAIVPVFDRCLIIKSICFSSLLLHDLHSYPMQNDAHAVSGSIMLVINRCRILNSCVHLNNCIRHDGIETGPGGIKKAEEDSEQIACNLLHLKLTENKVHVIKDDHSSTPGKYGALSSVQPLGITAEWSHR